MLGAVAPLVVAPTLVKWLLQVELLIIVPLSVASARRVSAWRVSGRTWLAS